MARVLHIDLETYSSVDIGKAGLYRYAQSPDFEILLFAYSFGDEDEVHVVDLTATGALPQNVLVALDDPDTELWAHNAAFEWYCLSKYLRREPASWAHRWRCTMVYGLYLAYPPSLKELGAALGIPADAQKDKTGKALIKYFCCPCKPTKVNGGRTRNLPQHDTEKWQLFIGYNRQDVVAEKKIHEWLSEVPIPDFIWTQWHQDLRMNERGVRVDKEMMDGALKIDARSTELLKQEMIQLTGLANPKSTQQLSNWIEQQTGVRPESLRKEYLEEMAVDETLPPLVRHVIKLKLMISKTSVSKYAAMERALGEGEKVRGMLQFYGAARTGRWAGRIVQLQNLARTHLDELDMARDICKTGDFDEMQLWYGNVPDTLSQLVRTCLIPDEGQVFVDADFSAIEARVIAWLAGEEWTLEVFRTTGKIYEATAANMFGVPVESIAKGQPNYPLRQRGKVATLALGYQGGTKALVNMGALRMGIPEKDLPDIKNKWRKANPHIVQFWDYCQKAAISAIETGRSFRIRQLLTFSMVETEHLRLLAVKLPSGRQIFYPKPGIGVNRFGEKSITYWGTSTGSGDKQSSKKWRQLETYGGKLTENCLAGNTLVLTDSGLLPITDVTTSHKVWDGEEWVSHDGLIYQGIKSTVRVGGLHMTHDHKILTEKGWVRCGEAEGLNWSAVQLPDSFAQVRRKHERRKSAVGMPVHLRQRSYLCGDGHYPQAASRKILWLLEKSFDRRKQHYARNVKTSGVGGVALHETKMQRPESSGVSQLRRTGHHCLRRMAAQFRELLARHGFDISTRAGIGQKGQQQGVFTRKLSLGSAKDKRKKQADESVYRNAAWQNDSGRVRRTNRHRRDNASVPNKSWMGTRIAVCDTGRSERVYDLRNCGARHRFCVYDPEEKQFRIVSNCVQAIARDCLAVNLDRLEKAGYDVRFHIHDEVVCSQDTNCLDEIVEIMSQPIDWAPGLPLNADGWCGNYFTKD